MSFSKKYFAVVALALVLSSASAETQLRGVATTNESSGVMDVLHRVLQFNIGGSARQGDVTGVKVTNAAGSTTIVLGPTPPAGGVISNAEGDEGDEDGM